MEYGNYYIYCISHDTKIDIKVEGFHNELVSCIVYKNLVAYVSLTNFTYLEANFDNLQKHEEVIGCVQEKAAVLPMSFSTICKSEEKVLELLKTYYTQFNQNLERIKGKEEMGIKVFYRLDFEAEDKQDKELMTNPKEYMMKRYERFQTRQNRIDNVLKPIEDYHKKLVECASESIAVRPLKNNLIFNASYLVEKGRRTEFDQAVRELIRNNPTYKIHYSGPWPAYHFVNIDREGVNDE